MPCGHRILADSISGYTAMPRGHSGFDFGRAARPVETRFKYQLLARARWTLSLDGYVAPPSRVSGPSGLRAWPQNESRLPVMQAIVLANAIKQSGAALR
jgi:hypothetical protein